MGRLNELEAFLAELQQATGKEQFTALFRRGCELLNLDDQAAAKVFDTSRPNVSRWRRGLVVPPAAGLVLRFLRERIEEQIRVARRIEAANKRQGLLESRAANSR